jgi:hypothetical protein
MMVITLMMLLALNPFHAAPTDLAYFMFHCCAYDLNNCAGQARHVAQLGMSPVVHGFRGHLQFCRQCQCEGNALRKLATVT